MIRTYFKVFAVIGFTAFNASASPVTDLSAYRSGQKEKYDTGGHLKAKGIRLTIEYPKSWQAQEGSHPNIVQKFIGKTDGGLPIQCLLQIKDLPVWARLVNGDIFTQESLKGIAKENSAEYVRGGTTKIEQETAGWLIYKLDYERTGQRASIYNLQYMIIYKGKFISVNFNILFPLDALGKQALFDSYLPLFQAIANTLILPDKWK
ncbi:MAG: hypothetical protein NTY53_07190 [Kiritimatiellaeota bacterium]|nr:hypothetical protein [Kiritimatiellota bacterium]